MPLTCEGRKRPGGGLNPHIAHYSYYGAPLPATTTFRLDRVLYVLPEYAAGLPAGRDASCIDRHLTRLATE